MITEVLMAILGGGVIGLVVGLNIGGDSEEIERLKNDLKTEKVACEFWYDESRENRARASEWKEKARDYMNRHNVLVEKYNKLYLSNKNKGRQTSPTVGSVNKSDLVAAVRVAMLNSHPDKTGKDTAADFIKYKEMYDEMRGR